jgi:hypothetical protein
MPRVGFELMIPVFERPKTVSALDLSVIGTAKFIVPTFQIYLEIDSKPK